MSSKTERLYKLRQAVRADTERVKDELASLNFDASETEKLMMEIASEGGGLIPSYDAVSIIAETFRSCSKYEAEVLLALLCKCNTLLITKHLEELARDPVRMQALIEEQMAKMPDEEKFRLAETARTVLTTWAQHEATEAKKDGYDA